MTILKKNSILICFLVPALLWSCRDVPVPKPRGYFRIDFPERKYRLFVNDEADYTEELPLSFEYPSYGEILCVPDYTEPGWFNINFPDYKARIYLTYKDVKGDLAGLIEQTYQMNVKNHISRADAIKEELIDNPQQGVYGILYDLKGNTATAVQFYVTDSIKHFFRGSLYFFAEPNPDSLAPVIEFFREDIVHLIETLKWEEK
jgi:gliding motility-associated lipoprotein GldD